MFDRRVNNWTVVNAYLFDTHFADGLTTEIEVNPEFGSPAAALIEAEKYGAIIGQLPHALRTDVYTVWIHKGTEPFGGGNHNLLIHTGQAELYEADGILEETFVHEASHTSLDANHASSPGWLAAQSVDDNFISTYARDNPTREDVAESFLPYLAVRYRLNRISQSLANTILQTIPNRISYFDNQMFDVYPLSVDNASVFGRYLFYNQSGTGGATVRYDGNSLAINSLDDNAIATDKVAYLPSAPGAATFANVSSYSKGINGVMIDIAGAHGSITADDFEFRVGNNNSPSTWALANPPTSVSVRAGAGVSGSDRVEIIWSSGAPFRQWLEVAVLANADTGLAALGGGYTGDRADWGDVFYFGNAVGNSGSGDTAVNSTVNAIDEGGARTNSQVVGNNIPITNIYDYNRNAVVNALDEAVSRANATNSATVLKYLNLADPPAAPEGDGDAGGDADAGVASALTALPANSAEVKVSRWLGLRLDEVDLNSGRVAEVLQGLHDWNTPTARKLLVKADHIADALNLDHKLLNSLLADLGLV